MATSKQIQAEIQKLEAVLAPIDDQLDSQVMQFSVELQGAVGEWMRAQVRTCIADSAEQVKSSGLEAMRSLKADFDALISRLPEICRQALGDSKQWPHRLKSVGAQHKAFQQQGSFFADVFRKAINPLGAVLGKHRVLAVKAGYIQSWERVSDTEYKYSTNPGFDERKFPSIAAFKKLQIQRDQVSAQLHTKGEELSRAQALELWDQA